MTTKTKRPIDVAALPKRASRPPQRAYWAEKLFDFIPSVGSTPKSGEQLAIDSGLTLRQVQLAVAYMRDTFPEFPLVSSPDGYYFTMDTDAVNAFRRSRMKSSLTIIRRTWEGAVKPFLEHIDNPLLSRTIQKQYDRLFEDLGDLVR